MAYCEGCGAEVNPGAVVCLHCGRSVGSAGSWAAPSEPIPTYLAQSILTTLLCCLPLGVVAIVFAAQVNSKQAAGDYAGALEASKKAKLFSTLSFIVAIVLGGAAFALGFIGESATTRQ